MSIQQNPVVWSRLHTSSQSLAMFCKEWRIQKLWAFGSVLRDDFHNDSDIDLLVEFDKNAAWTLFDFVSIQNALSQLMQHQIDLVEIDAVQNSASIARREHILNTAEVIYGA